MEQILALELIFVLLDLSIFMSADEIDTMKGDYMKKEKLPTQLKPKKMWCRNCGKLKEKSVCVCGISSWSASKIL